MCIYELCVGRCRFILTAVIRAKSVVVTIEQVVKDEADVLLFRGEHRLHQASGRS